MGWAHWVNSGLVECGLGYPDHKNIPTMDLLLIEVPQVYPGGPKVDPNDLITLALTAGRHVQRFIERGKQTPWVKSFPCFAVWPRTWKGTLDKEVKIRQIQSAIGPDNRVRAEACMRGDLGPEVPRGKRHNVWDAVGLGHWAVLAAANAVRLGKDPLWAVTSLKDYEFRPL